MSLIVNNKWLSHFQKLLYPLISPKENHPHTYWEVKEFYARKVLVVFFEKGSDISTDLLSPFGGNTGFMSDWFDNDAQKTEKVISSVPSDKDYAASSVIATSILSYSELFSENGGVSVDDQGNLNFDFRVQSNDISNIFRDGEIDSFGIYFLPRDTVYYYSGSIITGTVSDANGDGDIKLTSTIVSRGGKLDNYEMRFSIDLPNNLETVSPSVQPDVVPAGGSLMPSSKSNSSKVLDFAPTRILRTSCKISGVGFYDYRFSRDLNILDETLRENDTYFQCFNKKYYSFGSSMNYLVPSTSGTNNINYTHDKTGFYSENKPKREGVLFEFKEHVSPELFTVAFLPSTTTNFIYHISRIMVSGVADNGVIVHNIGSIEVAEHYPFFNSSNSSKTPTEIARMLQLGNEFRVKIDTQGKGYKKFLVEFGLDTINHATEDKPIMHMGLSEDKPKTLEFKVPADWESSVIYDLQPINGFGPFPINDPSSIDTHFTLDSTGTDFENSGVRNWMLPFIDGITSGFLDEDGVSDRFKMLSVLGTDQKYHGVPSVVPIWDDNNRNSFTAVDQTEAPNGYTISFMGAKKYIVVPGDESTLTSYYNTYPLIQMNLSTSESDPGNYRMTGVYITDTDKKLVFRTGTSNHHIIDLPQSWIDILDSSSDVEFIPVSFSYDQQNGISRIAFGDSTDVVETQFDMEDTSIWAVAKKDDTNYKYTRHGRTNNVNDSNRLPLFKSYSKFASSTEILELNSLVLKEDGVEVV